MGIIRVTKWVIEVINLPTKSPDTPSRSYQCYVLWVVDQ